MRHVLRDERLRVRNLVPEEGLTPNFFTRLKSHIRRFISSDFIDCSQFDWILQALIRLNWLLIISSHGFISVTLRVYLIQTCTADQPVRIILCSQ